MGMDQHGWYGSVWVDVDQYEWVWISMDGCGSVWMGIDQYGWMWIIWMGVDQYRWIWISVDGYESVRMDMDPYGWISISMEVYGSVWMGMD